MKIQNIKIAHKLALVFSTVGILTIASITVIDYFQFSHSLIERTQSQLNAINSLKKNAIEHYLYNQKQFLTHFQQEDSIQLFQHFLEQDFTKVYLLNHQKKVIYEQGNQQVDVAKLIPQIPNISEVWIQDITEVLQANEVFIQYVLKVPQGFLICIEQPFKIQEVVFERTGMGETGESYLVGKNLKMRTKSRFFPFKKPFTLTVNTLGARMAFKDDKIHEAIFEDYRKVKVLSCFRKIEHLNWVLLTEIDYEEALKPVRSMGKRLIYIAILNIIIILGVSYSIASVIALPIVSLEKIIGNLSIGKQTQVKYIHRQDEIGKISQAIASLMNNFQKITLFAEEIGKGNFEADFQPLSNHDSLGYSLLEMRHQLQILNHQADVLSRQAKTALITGQEEERIRLSRELHDSIGPMLTVIKLKITTLQCPTDEKQNLKELMDETIAEVRRISNNLMPSVLIDFGISPALQNLIKSIGNTAVQITYRDELKKKASLLTKDTNVALYRIAQEALNNALKHAKATEIKISLTEFDDKVVLFIKDNGQGFDVEAFKNRSQNTNGLYNMQERAKILRGEFWLESNEHGTEIEVEIPI
jgi:two-component system, NarL family, sensor kinase